MIEPLLLFVINFIYIAFKAFQQKNVMHDNYVAMVPTSVGMAFCETFIMGTIAVIAVAGNSWMHSVVNATAMGLGGGLGSVGATWYHNKLRGK
jgi:hypothetical protein